MTVVITGGAGSIGRATAEVFARDGAKVWVLDLPPALERARADMAGIAAGFLDVDVTDAAAVRQAVAQVLAETGRIDVAVACAGVSAGTALEEISADEFSAIVAVNLGGAFNLMQAVAGPMRTAGGGRIVLLGSVAAQQGGVRSGPHYVAAKAGVHGLARWAAKNLGPYNVRVNTVAPGPVLTAMWEGLGGTADEGAEGYPLGRMGRPGDIAEAIHFLGGPRSDWITGSTLDINGGMYLR
ncbi:SDR family NAD(P)-dependent oxidoreductase [Dactylosporangium sp. NPDC051485]|uniref:SDR family NAD(P)-dependent oxidoreductase n=1 Tax=Dactylosporangium sp. NPDC051485 TaxID=3154846 RepID=UPI00341C91B4